METIDLISVILENSLSELTYDELSELSNDDLIEILEQNDFVYVYSQNEYYYRDEVAYCDGSNEYWLSEDTFFCEWSNLYFNTETFTCVNIGGSDVCLQRYEDSLFYIDGEYYHQDEVYYWESDGEYHLEPEPEDKYNFSYHSSSPWDLSEGSEYKIGFEIEKEDREEMECYYAYDLQNDYGWGKESDGSLDSYSGFELVSPIFDLSKPIPYFEDEFNKIESLINANYSKNCGGHINISYSKMDALSLFDSIKGYIPLLYSIYPHRINRNYCEAKSCDKLKEDRVKYQAINIKYNGILEFRIFPAVKNTKNLLWRVNLIKLMLANPTSDFLQVVLMLANKESELHALFLEIFDLEKINSKVIKMIEVIRLYEGINPSFEQMSKIEQTLKLK
jgi:hypothetical protein